MGHMYRHGEAEQPDYHQLKDKNGEFILCYQCRKTALRKPMIGCDFCILHWHLDCLNPPMASPPNPAKKWRCPNHIEHLIVMLRKNATDGFFLTGLFLARNHRDDKRSQQSSPTNNHQVRIIIIYKCH